MLMWRWRLIKRFVDCVICALNILYGVNAQAGQPIKLTAAQSDVLARLVDRACTPLERMQGARREEINRFLPDWVLRGARSSSLAVKLSADRVDNPVIAGTCDPMSSLPLDVQETLSNPELLFPKAEPFLAAVGECTAASKDEYAKHVVNHLRCGKVALAANIKGAGAVFQ